MLYCFRFNIAMPETFQSFVLGCNYLYGFGVDNMTCICLGTNRHDSNMFGLVPNIHILLIEILLLARFYVLKIV